MTNLLYLSCHSTLEHDELKIFSELGLNVFSVGSYIDPEKPLESLRPPLNLNTNPEWAKQFKEICPNYTFNGRARLTKKFVDQFDIVMISHFTHYFEDNWSLIKDKPLIYAPVGQSTAWLEGQLSAIRRKADMKIVRVSAAESVLNNYAGHDAIIRPIVDSEEFNNWTGEQESVVTVNKWMKKRSGPCLFNEYCMITQGMSRVLYGQANEDIEFSSGSPDFDQLKEGYRVNRCSLSMGTKPAPFTYTFMEALMTGCPVVTVGPRLGNGPRPTYEAYKFLENGVDGFWSDDIGELRYYIKQLLSDHDLAKRISKAGREKALSLFDRKVCREAWREFLNRDFGLNL